MKLIQFRHPRKGVHVGILSGDDVLDITRDGVSGSLDVIRLAAERKMAIEDVARELADRTTTLDILSFEDLNVRPRKSKPHLLAPIFAPEVWGCGVTYKRSAQVRDEDSAKDIYTRVYESERPEIFFKATPSRCVGPNDFIGIRRDSKLTATEPELAYVLGAGHKIVAYTICNDVSAWDLERENPLYLPQSKTFTGCCALGPVLVTADEIPDPYDLDINCRIVRGGRVVFHGTVNSSKINRKFDQLTEFLRRDNPIPLGTVVSTGTGIMAPNDHALRDGDVVEVEIARIGKLSNPVRQLPGG
ncbi:MAG: hypothetical protein FJ279_13800 [Planctomycetes bacterium]|nr:hypothetical protein [Planctomycetota bacterium]